MHEISIVEDIIELVSAECRKGPFARVRVIRIEVGALGHAEPEALRFCFDAVACGTIADGARLEIETVAGQGWCDACRCTVPLEERFASCPACEKSPLKIVAGAQLRLAELEVE